jgi:hypothetical protein
VTNDLGELLAFKITRGSRSNSQEAVPLLKETQKLSSHEKQLLNQRGIIETVIGHLKHCYQVWHTRHRSMINTMTHLVAALAAYAIEPLKLSAIKLLSNCKS